MAFSADATCQRTRLSKALRLAAHKEGVEMGEIVGFVSKAELERLRLIRDARAIYDSIFPPTDTASERPADRSSTSEAIRRHGLVIRK